MLWGYIGLVPLAAALAPKNPFVAESPWPQAHHDVYCQASSMQPGPHVGNVDSYEVDSLMDSTLGGTLSVYWRDNVTGVAWGASTTSIYKIDTLAVPTMQILDAVRKPSTIVEGDLYSGIYSLVSSEGVFYTAASNAIFACHDNKQPGGPIVPIGIYLLDPAGSPPIHGSPSPYKGNFSRNDRYRFPRFVSQQTPPRTPNEAIISLNMLFTGHLAFVTSVGRVGVVTRDLKKRVDMIELSSGVVSNAMAVDENGGIYVVSSNALHKVVWKGNKLSLAWSTAVPRMKGPQRDRISKEGSGSTPTLFRDEEALPLTDTETRVPKGDGDHQGKLLVAITDGEQVQNLRIYDASTGNEVCSAVVDFGIMNIQESYTEQSLLVYGNEIVITQNALTPKGKSIESIIDALDLNQVLEAFKGRRNEQSKRFKTHLYVAPYFLGDTPRGLQKFRYRDGKVESVWAVQDYGCPNSVHTFSVTTGLIYCVSKGIGVPGPVTRPYDIEPYPDGFEGHWTIAGIDWNTGRKVFDLPVLGKDDPWGIKYNSLFAATQIGPGGIVVYGAQGGIVRARPIHV